MIESIGENDFASVTHVACKQAPLPVSTCAHLDADWAASFFCIIHMQAPHPIALPILVLGVVSISEPAGISLYGRHARAVSARDR